MFGEPPCQRFLDIIYVAARVQHISGQFLHHLSRAVKLAAEKDPAADFLLLPVIALAVKLIQAVDGGNKFSEVRTAPGKIIGHVLHVGKAFLLGHVEQAHHAAVSVLDIHRPTQIADGTAVADLPAQVIEHHLHVFLLLMRAVIHLAAAVGQLSEDLGRTLQAPRREHQPPPIILLLHGFEIKAGKHSLAAL